MLSGIRRPSLCPSISSRGFRCERAHGGIRIADLAFHEKPDLRKAVRQAVQRTVPAGVRQLPTPATSQRRRRLQLPAASWALHCTQFCQAISMTFRSAYTFGSLCLPFGILRGLRQKSRPAPKPVASKLFFSSGLSTLQSSFFRSMTLSSHRQFWHARTWHNLTAFVKLYLH